MILINHGAETFAIARGDRIAQLVLAPVVQAAWEEVEELDDTARGAGGFGSTGGHAGSSSRQSVAGRLRGPLRSIFPAKRNPVRPRKPGHRITLRKQRARAMREPFENFHRLSRISG